MMVTVAGLPMWKHYSKAVALGMPLWACQILSKEYGEGEEKKGKGIIGGFCWPEMQDFTLYWQKVMLFQI